MLELQRPPAPRPGDLVAVVAPCGPVDPSRLARGVRWLEELGLRVRLGAHVLDRDGHGLAFLAGADAARAADLEAAWCDPGVRAVLAARGGTGAGRVVARLDWDRLAAAGPVLLAGSSDVTALHLAVAARLRLGSLWAPMVAGELLGGEGGPEPTTAAAFARALLRPECGLELVADAPVVLGPDRPAEGPLVGGTLSVLAAALGTADQPRTAGGVLVLEDVGEAPHRLDRMLGSLRAAGLLDGVAGVAGGSWTSCGDPVAVAAVLRDRLGGLGVPVLLGLPFGHGPTQGSLPLGSVARILPAQARLVVPGSPPAGSGDAASRGPRPA